MDIASLLIPLLLAGTALWALRKRIDVYDALTAGASEGLLVLARIAPSLIALLTAVYMLRASGALTLLTRLLTPVLERLGIPPETAALLLVRPVSGSGALAVGSELMAAHGPDSYIGRCAAVMLGCTETTFYTIAVYFGAAGIRRTRYTVPVDVPAAAQADLALLTADEEKALIKQLAQYPVVVRLAARDYDPSFINRYLSELAAAFHKFYNACRIKGEEKDVLLARLKLADTARAVLKNGMTLIGCSAPEKM